jgi:hypothetical protein
MLERIKDLPAGVDGVRATGRVSREDYERVMLPLVEDARREGRHVRFLYEFAPELEGFTAGAAWEDAKLGLHFLRLFEGCAILADVAWLRDSVQLVGVLVPFPVRAFSSTERADALAWLAALPHHEGVSHRLIAESGVLVVEVTSPLRREDFDSVSATVDGWIEAHGVLRGVVIRARTFPGWENLAGFLAHLRFVRDHHRKVRRVALAADGEIAKLAPELAKHFVEAEAKHFDYAAIDQAIAWAGAKSER